MESQVSSLKRGAPRQLGLAKGLLSACLLMLSAGAWAQSSNGRFRIEPVLVGGAGGDASGGAFALHGSFGQSATANLEASPYRLAGGFWAAAGAEPDGIIFADGFDAGNPVQPGTFGTGFVYQGQLSNGSAAANGSYDLQFALYVAATGSSAVDTRTFENFSVDNGLVHVLLDFTDEPFGRRALWVEVRVRDGGDTGAYTALAPRQPLNAAPYAIFALHGGGSATLNLPYFGSTDSTAAAFQVFNGGLGEALHGVSAGNTGIYGTSSHAAGNGIRGSVAGQGPQSAGVLGSNDQGAGVRGVNLAARDGHGIGVLGESQDPNGAGVKGVAFGANAAGVYGSNDFGAGVWGSAVGGGGSGVYGYSVDGVGVRGAGTTAMRADGDAVQALASGGWVKAMVVVNEDGSIARCFNSQAAGALRDSQGCGIQSSIQLNPSQLPNQIPYVLTFPFNISQAYTLVTQRNNPQFQIAVLMGPASFTTFSVSDHQARVRCTLPDNFGYEDGHCKFTLIVL